MSDARQESEVMRQAMDCLRAGDGLAAEQLAAEAVKRASDAHGDDSPEHAAAQFDLAKILVAVGDLHRAASALRQACNMQCPDEQASKDRLTYVMNLGEVLPRLGELEEAEEVLREALLDRAAIYCEEHPGYAFGLEPLAEVLRLRGNLEEAREIIDEAVGILESCGHPRLFSALACRGSIARAQGAAAFPGAAALSDEGLEALVEAVLGRAEQEDPSVHLKVMLELRDLLQERREGADPWLLHLVGAISMAARAAGEHAARQEALRWLVEAQRARGDLPQTVNALLGLGLAEDEAGQVEASESSYRQAVAEAEGVNDPCLLSRVLRNFGLFLAQRERREEAATMLTAALAAAEASGDVDTRGRALISLGISLQHGGALEEARGLLEQALDLLDPGHPDTLYARSHLEAIISGGSCGCGDMSVAIGEALKTMILAHCPPDLIERLDIAVEASGEPRFEIGLAREPAPGETELLERVVHQATSELRRRIKEQQQGT